MRQFKIIVEKHPDGYVAYPLGPKGVVVGEGDTYEEALADVKSAIQFHVETFFAKPGNARRERANEASDEHNCRVSGNASAGPSARSGTSLTRPLAG